MDSIPTPDEVYSVYLDQVAASEFLWRLRIKLLAEAKPGTRFYGLTESALNHRLAADRSELDHWSVMMMTASFEAVLWTDAELRVKERSKDRIGRLIKQIYDEAEQKKQRVRFVDLLDQYHCCPSLTTMKKNQVNRLLTYRHWIAHGRRWVEKKVGQPIGPMDAIQIIYDYTDSLQRDMSDFPRG